MSNFLVSVQEEGRVLISFLDLCGFFLLPPLAFSRFFPFFYFLLLTGLQDAYLPSVPVWVTNDTLLTRYANPAGEQSKTFVKGQVISHCSRVTTAVRNDNYNARWLNLTQAQRRALLIQRFEIEAVDAVRGGYPYPRHNTPELTLDNLLRDNGKGFVELAESLCYPLRLGNEMIGREEYPILQLPSWERLMGVSSMYGMSRYRRGYIDVGLMNRHLALNRCVDRVFAELVRFLPSLFSVAPRAERVGSSGSTRRYHSSSSCLAALRQASLLIMLSRHYQQAAQVLSMCEGQAEYLLLPQASPLSISPLPSRSFLPPLLPPPSSSLHSVPPLSSPSFQLLIRTSFGREHQVQHWKTGHKRTCGRTEDQIDIPSSFSTHTSARHPALEAVHASIQRQPEVYWTFKLRDGRMVGLSLPPCLAPLFTVKEQVDGLAEVRKIALQAYELADEVSTGTIALLLKVSNADAPEFDLKAALMDLGKMFKLGEGEEAVRVMEGRMAVARGRLEGPFVKRLLNFLSPVGCVILFLLPFLPISVLLL